MVDNLALGVLAAGSGTRILTFVPNAGTVRRTIGVQDTLGATTFVRISKVILDAGTRTSTVLLPTVGVGAARTWDTRGQILFGIVGLNELAAGERIAGVSFLARTARRVVHHGTLGVEAARTGARVGTLLPNARLVLGTFRAEHALGPAVWRRSGVVRQARAGFLASDDLALGVRTAR